MAIFFAGALLLIGTACYALSIYYCFKFKKADSDEGQKYDRVKAWYESHLEEKSLGFNCLGLFLLALSNVLFDNLIMALFVLLVATLLFPSYLQKHKEAKKFIADMEQDIYEDTEEVALSENETELVRLNKRIIRLDAELSTQNKKSDQLKKELAELTQKRDFLLEPPSYRDPPRGNSQN